eukprot:TRINITY_DN4437_c0_g1_i1.p1 TRINITY_DN4437_c0_g1~~TRINITY_DN4437_c0_g1_i1.p1  ORF type:complete len:689 (-),score=249.77 TRINITY_DN4437_c0_g1_i1:59-2125(-)
MNGESAGGGGISIVPNASGAKIYNVSVGKSAPEWIKTNKKSLKYDNNYRRRIELLQDFDFPCTSSKVQVSNNGEFIISTGTYPPMLKIHECSQLTLKVSRNLTADVINFNILSNDYSKLALLKSDRSLEFHAQFGRYHIARIPKFGRDLVYDSFGCDMIVVGASSDAWRINLETGTFLQPYSTNLSEINVVSINPVHHLLAFGGDDGSLEFWDPRARRPVCSKDFYSDLPFASQDQINATSVQFDQYNGLNFALGTSSGHCLLYDMRMSQPSIVKDHQNDLPLKKIIFAPNNQILTSDSKIVKIWDKTNPKGTLTGSIEPSCSINDVSIVGDSGLILMACEQPKLMAYFIPSLGPAPKWCSFLDSLTEELEEDKQTLYDDYKFVTNEDLKRLGLERMIGSHYLKPYMHGYFMDIKLYNKFKAIADPFEFENYRKEKIQQKIEEERETRIAVKKKAPKVNAKMAASILQEGAEKEEKGKKSTTTEVLSDPRFKALFENPDFEVDESDDRFKATRNIKLKKEAQLTDFFDMVKEQDNDPEEGKEAGIDIFGEDDEGKSDDSEGESEKYIRPAKKKVVVENKDKQKGKKVNMYEVKEGHQFQVGTMNASAQRAKKLPFGQRVKELNESSKAAGEITKEGRGSLQISFTPSEEKQKGRKSQEQRQEWASRISERRGIKELKLPKIGGKRRRG